MIYIQCTIPVSAISDKYPFSGEDIVSMALGEIGFESFVTEEGSLKAYSSQTDLTSEVLSSHEMLAGLPFSWKELENENWNETWESRFDPVWISDECRIRGTFHEKIDSLKHDIVIQPKMSFGTGHHATTSMMCQWILEDDFADAEVLDAGCGSGILAIVSSLEGATKLQAYDIDDWCIENTLENMELNQVKNITTWIGTAGAIPKGSAYTHILANINRNILLQDMDVFYEHLQPSGMLYLSGFYQSDIPLLLEKSTLLGMHHIATKEEGDWRSLKLQKPLPDSA